MCVAYSSDDWKRLVGLKEHRDPRNLFRFNRNIALTFNGEQPHAVEELAGRE